MRVARGARLEAEGSAGDRLQDLLLVLDGSAAVAGDAGGIGGRDGERIDVAVRDRQSEVVADEGTEAAGIGVSGARHLVDPTDRLIRLLRIPGELRDLDVAADGDGSRPIVSERL